MNKTRFEEEYQFFIKNKIPFLDLYGIGFEIHDGKVIEVNNECDKIKTSKRRNEVPNL